MPEEPKVPEVQEPAAPSPDEIFSSALGGSSVADYLGGTDVPSVPDPEPPQPSIEPDAAVEMQKKIEALEENAKTQHGNWNQEHMARLQAENFVGAMQTARHQEMAAAQQAAALAPPQFDPDLSEVIDDPQKLGEEINRRNQAYAQWSADRTMGAIWPYVQQYQTQQAQVNAVLKSSVQTLLDKGRDILTREHGVSPDDFETYRPQIEHAFTNLGPQGVEMLSDPDNIVGSYAMLAMKDNKPFNAKPQGDREPFHADSTPSRQRGNASLKQTPPELQNLWSKMKADFGFEAPTLGDMQAAGIDISRYQKG